MKRQRGGFVLGLVMGLLLGLALALGVALYITKVPVPFINKVPQRTAAQDSAEAERNRAWDPNAPLSGKPVPRAAPASAPTPGVGGVAPVGAAPTPAPAAGPAPSAARVAAPAPPAAARDPAAILSGAAVPAPARSTAPGVEPFIYFIQAGAFTRSEDAEQQRAKLALMGQAANITEREQAGRVVYRVRIGPLRTREEADGLQVRLQESSLETQIVRVERP